MFKILATNVDRVFVQQDDVILFIELDTGAVFVKTEDEMQNIMARGYWSDDIPEVIVEQVNDILAVSGEAVEILPATDEELLEWTKPSGWEGDDDFTE